MIDKGRQYTAFMDPLPKSLQYFSSAQDTVRLYHYSPFSGESLLVDPERFGESGYTRNEANRSKYPRSFFYLDPIANKELVVSPNMYFGDYDITKIYDLLLDTEGVKERSKEFGAYNFDTMFKLIHEELGFDGVYYYPNMHVVSLFVPFRVTPVESFESDPFLMERMIDYIEQMTRKLKPLSKDVIQWAQENGIEIEQENVNEPE